MAHNKILYERSQVFIKERPLEPETRAGSLDEITGTITIVENERGKLFRFIPLGLTDGVTDEWALVSGNHSIISYKNTGNNDGNSLSISPKPLLKYRFQFNLNDLRSVRRHHMLHGIAHMVFVLKDGTTLPAFHFNLGGSKELVQKLNLYLRLEKSPQDSRLYIVKDNLPQENLPQPASAFDQLNLFDNDTIKRFRGSDSRRTAIERFSKVTHFFKDALLGQNELITASDNTDGAIGPDITALMESFNGELRESNNDGFEVIYKVDFKKLPEVLRSQPLTSKEWQMSFDKEGRLIDVNKMKERIFRGGLESNTLRREVWKFLLNSYPWSSTRDERIELSKQRELEYFAMKLQWKSMNEQQKQRNNLFRDRESLIEKDVTRTDRTHEYFQGDNNVHLEVLHDVLMSYNMFNFDLGYVQGMNDLLSPILIVMENEVESFWCFVGLMARMEQNFHMDQSHITRQLGDLHTLLQFIDAELATYLVENNSSNMYFFFRWMLICFKREFSFDDVMHLWEVLWTDHLCQNFELLVCLAILISQKTVIMESKFGCNEILKHINDLSLKVPLEPLLKHAEGLYILLQQHDQSTPGLPPSISAIMFPNKNKNLKKLNRRDDHDSDSDATSTISSVKSSRETSPKPDERKPRTRHLTESHSIDENDSAVISMSEKKLKVDSDDDDDDDDEDDDDYCPTKNVNEQSDASEESAHEDDGNDRDEHVESEKQSDLNIKPYDESKTSEFWKNFSSDTKSTSVTTAKESPKPTTTITSKVFEYAGEKVEVPVTAAAATTPSLKRPAASSNSLLDRLGIGKKQKLSTLEKSRLDWSVHKQSESLVEDLDSHRRGKDSFVEKKAFLQRTETREHDNYLTNVKKK